MNIAKINENRYDNSAEIVLTLSPSSQQSTMLHLQLRIDMNAIPMPYDHAWLTYEFNVT